MDERRRLVGRFVLIGAAMAAALIGAVWPLIGAGAPDEDALMGVLAALAVICAGLVHLWVFIDGRIVRPLAAEAEAGRRRLEAVLGALDEGVIVCTADHRVALCNAAAARRLGGAVAVGESLDRAAIESALRGLTTDPSGRTLRTAGTGEDGGYVITFAVPAGEGPQGVPDGHLPV